jgi:lipopolysaccharide export system permease protein
MTRITRYIGREIAVPSVLALVVFAFIGVIIEVRERLSEIDLSNVNIADFARMAFWFMPTLLYYIVPLTYMMGIMMAFGRMTRDNEMIAMKAAGLSLKRVVAPVIIGGALLSVFCMVLQDRVQPMALRKVNALIFTELPKRVTMDVLAPGVMHELGPWRVFIGSRDEASGTLENVDILAPQDSGDIWLFHAESARFFTEDGSPVLLISKGYWLLPGEGGRTSLTDFRLSVPPPEVQSLEDMRRMLTLPRLLEKEKEVARELALTESPRAMREVMALRDEIRERVAMPWACLAISLVAAPLAVRGGRRGRTYSFAIGFGVCLVYYILLLLTQPTRVVSLAEMVARGSLPNVLLGAVGVVALWRVDRV